MRTRPCQAECCARAQVELFLQHRDEPDLQHEHRRASRNQPSFRRKHRRRWSGDSVNGTFNHSEWFANDHTSAIDGQLAASCCGARRAPSSRVRRSISRSTSEYAHPADRAKNDGTLVDDSGLGRFDFTPQIRYPFKRWQFLTVNSTRWLARDVLHAQPGSGGHQRRHGRHRPEPQPPLFHDAGAARRPRVQRVSGIRRTTATPRSSSTQSSRTSTCSGPRRSTTTHRSSRSTASIRSSGARPATHTG